MFKNICNWSKCIAKPILEVASWDHVVHKEISAGSIVRKTVQVLAVVWKDKEFQRELFRSISGISTQQNTFLKTTEFTLHFQWTFQHLEIQKTNKQPLVKRLWPETLQGYPNVHFQVSAYTMNLLGPYRIERGFLIRSVQFCKLAAGCVRRVLASTNWSWPSQSIGIRS